MKDARNWAGAALLLALAIIAVAPSLQGDFLWDDSFWLWSSYVTPQADGLVRAWTEGDRYDFLPLTSSVFWIEWRLFHNHATGYRVVNALLHGLGAFFLWRLLRKLPLSGAFAVAALFACHPVAVASVAWITELKNTLSGVLFFAAMWAYLHSDERPRSRGIALAFLLFLTALTAKASTVVFPAILALLLLLKRPRLTRSDLLRLAPFFAVALVAALAASSIQSKRAIGLAEVHPEGFAQRWAAAGAAIAFYLGKAIAPFHLSVIYPRWDVVTSRWSTWVPLVATLLAFAGLFAALRQNRLSAAARNEFRTTAILLSAYIVALIPVLGIVDLAWFRFSLVADHWQYLALPWALALAVDLVARALGRISARAALVRRPPAHALAALTVVLFAFLSFQRSRAYANEGALWSDTLARNPDAWAAHNSYGMWLAQQGRRDDARLHFEEASRLRPTYSYPLYNLALTYVEEGDFPRAKQYLGQALELAPNYPDALASLGGIVLAEGDVEQAVQKLQASLQLEERNAGAHCNLGIAYLAQREPQRAAQELERAAQLDPTLVQAPYHLARARIQLGDLLGAREAMQRVLVLAPNHPDAVKVMQAIENAIGGQGTMSSPEGHPATEPGTPDSAVANP
ncbi:MAG TPA: tetratricopeptide repeat protein [bacterium]|nr:tetratricopeptide repeat protein [bacterium]